MNKNTYYFASGIILAAVVAILAYIAPRRPSPAETSSPAKTTDHPLEKTAAFFDKTIIDLGDVKQFSPIFGNYTLRNTGSSGLLIENTMTNCTCTTAFFDKRVIKPKDSTVVTIRYDSTRTGIFQSTGIVTSNGSAEPILLILRGNVMPAENKQ